MPTRTNKRTGEVQQLGPDGQWITVKPGSNMIQTRGPDQLLPLRVKKATNDAAASQFAPQTAQADATIKSAQAASAATVAQAERDKSIADAQKTQTELQILKSGGNKLDPAVRQKAIQQYSYAKQLDDTANQLEELYRQGPGKTKGIMGTADYLPLATNKNFDVAANKSRGIVGQTLGFTGGQLNTPQEAEKAVGPYIPEASDYDSTITQKIQSMRDLAAAQRANAMQTLGGVPDENGNITPLDQSLATGKTRNVVDPAASKALDAMVRAGRPYSEAVNYAKAHGFDAPDAQVYNDAVQYHRDHPEYKGSFGEATKSVPTTLSQRAAASPVGAFAASAANAITGDRLGSISGNPQAMDALRQTHPYASLAGDIAGQATDEALLGRVPGLNGLLATRVGRRVGDFGYGAFSGTGDDSGGDPLTGGLVGGLVNMGGGMAGRSVQRGIGRAATGVRDPQVNYLADQGVPLTPGRIGRGSENIVGKAVGGVEERLAGLPGFDAVIGAARQRGDEAFNSAAFRQAGGSGATGAAGLTEVNALKNNAYGFLNGTDIPLDAQFAGRNAAVKAGIPDLPGFGNEVGLTLGQLDKVSKGGRIAGPDWQSALSDVRGDRSSIVGKPFASKAVKSLKDVENNLLELADRQGPAGTVDNLNAANALNAKSNTLAAALDKGPVQRNGQMFSAQNLDDASRMNTKRYGGRMASLTGANRPFYELSQAGLDVMPNLTPDSGTGGRLALIPLAAAVPGGIGAGLGALTADDRSQGAQSGGEIGTGGYLGTLALASLLYSKPGQKVLQKALIGQRPDRITKLGDLLINNAATGGKVGSGLARGYAYTLADLLGQ